MTDRVDPVAAALAAQTFEAVAREMGATIEHGSSSRYLQNRDMATSIFDRAGRLIAQGEYLPLMAFALRPQLEAVIATFGEDVADGDAFVASDVFHGGNQSLDLAVLVPVFVGGKLQFWTAAKGHVADLGGAVAGGYVLEGREIWQENVRIPPLRIVRAGRRLEDRWRLLGANSRTPDLLLRDIGTMLGASRRGAEKLIRYARTEGIATVGKAVDDLLRITADAAARAVAGMRAGEYRAEAVLPPPASGSVGSATARLKLTVTRAGHAHFDFTGTDPQVPTIANSPLAATQAAVLCALFMCVPADIPRNDGWTAVTTIEVPEGSFLYPRLPAATQTGNFTANNTAGECVLKALAQAAPDRATAGWTKCLGSTFTTTGPDGTLAIDSAFFNNKGGSGACQGFDGFDHIGSVILGGGSLTNDYERFEAQNPYRVLTHELWTDSGGAGTWRGGLGTRSTVLIDSDDCTLVLHGDPVTRPHGIYGGRSAPPNRYELELPSGETVTPSGLSRTPLPRGTRVHNWNSGGGGYGEPAQRSRDAVARDLAEGFISPEAAAIDYRLEPSTQEIT